MNIKISRSTRLANELFNLFVNSNRDLSTVTASMVFDEESIFECGYSLSEKSNQRRIVFYGHINYDKYKIYFTPWKSIEVDDIDEAYNLIISFLFVDENNEKLNKVLR